MGGAHGILHLYMACPPGCILRWPLAMHPQGAR